MNVWMNGYIENVEKINVRVDENFKERWTNHIARRVNAKPLHYEKNAQSLTKASNEQIAYQRID